MPVKNEDNNYERIRKSSWMYRDTVFIEYAFCPRLSYNSYWAVSHPICMISCYV